MPKLLREFYARDAIVLAPVLIGKTIIHRVGGEELRARIVETEAYVGTHDLACHASKGRTRRTEVMFGPAGHAYVYLIYGMYDMFNIVASVDGDAQAVLIRAAEWIDGNATAGRELATAPRQTKSASGSRLRIVSRASASRDMASYLSGPGKFAGGMRITRADNGVDLTGDKIFLLDDSSHAPKLMKSKRVGVDYAGKWKHELLRFFDADSNAVSKPRSPALSVER